MHQVRAKVDRSRTLTVANTQKLVKGHPAKQGAGAHTDKRDRRSSRASRNQQAIREYC
jgi:hypothetical protein